MIALLALPMPTGSPLTAVLVSAQLAYVLHTDEWWARHTRLRVCLVLPSRKVSSRARHMC